MKRFYSTLLAVVMGLMLAGCDKPVQATASEGPVGFHRSDECHVCGMVISDFPGPKGEVVEQGGVKKFCSTAEMIGWWMQPENHHQNAKLYVHDMGKSHWDTPDDAHLIDAKIAFYVLGTGLKGAMGVVLASFADEAAAQKVAADTGGRVLRFGDIDLALLQQPVGMSHMGH
ncbi:MULTISPECIES: nitrous oxide reductase accessory protein NosL [unclassified Pseudomonas]|uniref:nitrous oxide reductase accessory protein NosL n=1 Tax=unclassified Pseudomonas TaxID=196821 RepID=UPI0011F02349|nr:MULTISPECIES: nitrous oxide reductase accessory protein NosL [unclassified Pseudomonas]KAA0947868.1 NosL protein [Pseudomonas sp. ANT_H4]KAA0947951.1 NosL protein [Pseudomonas sp. ANT_H14]